MVGENLEAICGIENDKPKHRIMGICSDARQCYYQRDIGLKRLACLYHENGAAKHEKKNMGYTESDKSNVY